MEHIIGGLWVALLAFLFFATAALTHSSTVSDFRKCHAEKLTFEQCLELNK